MRCPGVPDAPAHGDDRIVEVRCAWCGRRALGERWVEPPADDESGARASHGICPDCLERLERRTRGPRPLR